MINTHTCNGKGCTVAFLCQCYKVYLYWKDKGQYFEYNDAEDGCIGYEQAEYIGG